MELHAVIVLLLRYQVLWEEGGIVCMCLCACKCVCVHVNVCMCLCESVCVFVCRCVNGASRHLGGGGGYVPPPKCAQEFIKSRPHLMR